MVKHWFDFMCPFCYIAQDRNKILARHGIEVVHLPYQIHPAIPESGLQAGPRVGPMYDNLAREAAAAGLTLNWPARLSTTRRALSAAEWIRRTAPDRSESFNERLFHAYFVDGEDLGDPAVVDRHAGRVDIDVDALREALSDGTAKGWLAESELAASEAGVRATPSWLIGGRLVSGLLPAAEFDRIAQNLGTT
ncbi:DsbA family protein [Kutzneria sp. 744]|uniref:DsbA family oxidoreductase n=1 Tax=Kutzneria sp. (strain 744) TaxID=345341 RepID=UPI0003EEC852|nr:DsbA family protein [Kutzneria sp. 744]EWM11059.1 DSBA oxidoreductase [Kutzneria sp. 744]